MAVTDRPRASGGRDAIHRGAGGLLLLFSLTLARAAVLPEDRTDLMYHYYSGGGVTVNGPAVLVRKSAGDNVSVSGRYYVDTVSSASVDVVTTPVVAVLIDPSVEVTAPSAEVVLSPAPIGAVEKTPSSPQPARNRVRIRVRTRATIRRARMGISFGLSQPRDHLLLNR